MNVVPDYQTRNAGCYCRQRYKLLVPKLIYFVKNDIWYNAVYPEVTGGRLNRMLAALPRLYIVVRKHTLLSYSF